MNNDQLINVANTIKSQIHPTILMCAAGVRHGTKAPAYRAGLGQL